MPSEETSRVGSLSTRAWSGCRYWDSSLGRCMLYEYCNTVTCLCTGVNTLYKRTPEQPPTKEELEMFSEYRTRMLTAQRLAKVEKALRDILEITGSTQKRPYTALNQISQVALEGLRPK